MNEYIYMRELTEWELVQAYPARSECVGVPSSGKPCERCRGRTEFDMRIMRILRPYYLW